MGAVMTTPKRSLEQSMEALEKANGIRTYRSRLKADMKRGRRDVRPVLSEPPEELATMKVYELLLSLPKYGRVKVNKTLGRCKISPSKTIGGLSERQRRELLAVIAGHRLPPPRVTYPPDLM